MIAEQLQNISKEELAMLAKELHLSRQCDSECKGWRLILAMVMEWESAQTVSQPGDCDAGSKKQFARALYNTSCNHKMSNESAELFKKVARAIDMTG